VLVMKNELIAMADSSFAMRLFVTFSRASVVALPPQFMYVLHHGITCGPRLSAHGRL
jgi:hypothetical protein